uniref:RRM domain-containing protein n=1 Tax=Chromera velia CCMP2878 TaxID=1169474 RepID=A0A0G4GWM5_9ALVE|eukprot:Cvel_23691.t1-p1 / transcript=Cvel_23691.t1 / gene=Cvel_23691 / organism=Chromera_velia_CCMP2878 / gene_product=hypothetical protein / transcript_product=hypothetical protein / location=Cvel_scaffold2471:17507-18828(+) / protein_length=277 / sequence_SO=supercontig / SO=protein_coding / is_pseudo=false
MFLEVSITGIPLGMDVFSITSFLNKALEASKLTMGGGDACVEGWISTDSAAAYVQIRSIEEATSILSLNGIPLRHNPLKIVRPPPLVELQAAKQAREQLGLMFEGSRPERVWISAAQVSGGAGLATQATIDVDAEELIPLRRQMFLEVSITGIPLGMDVLSITSFLNKAMEASKLTMRGGDATCVGGWISTDGAAAYVQMRSIEEATSILSLNGIPLMHNLLKIVRTSPLVELLVELQAAEQAREQLGLMFEGSRPERVWISGLTNLTKEYTPVFFK